MIDVWLGLFYERWAMVIKVKASEIAEVLESRIDPSSQGVIPSGYSIDSRTLEVGDCFIAIRGKRLDGHEFIPEAIRKGASFLIVNRDVSNMILRDTPRLFVKDTLLALQQLACQVRRRWEGEVVGITGSAGKTTTKEIVSHVLAGKFKVFKSVGNYNNDYGLPLSLLKLESDHKIAVLELGMSAPGEIARLSRIAQPNLGIVTNVKPVHLEFFSSIRSIARSKRELIDHLPNDGVAFLNNDDVYVRKFARYFNGKIVTFGIERPAAYRVDQIQSKGLVGSDFRLRYHGRSHWLTLPLLGSHNVINCLPGIALAHRLGLSFDAIATRLQDLKAEFGRGRPLYFEGGFCVIDDSYNSNPAALMMMMRLVGQIQGYKRKILVVGEMLEIGDKGLHFHEVCAKAAAHWHFDIIIGIQGLANQMVVSTKSLGYDSNSSIFFRDAREAGQWLSPRVRSGDLILVKGSRGVKTERVIETLTKDFGLSA